MPKKPSVVTSEHVSQTKQTVPPQEGKTPVKTQKKRIMKRKGWGEENQEKVQYAYELGGEQFVYLLNAENGQWTHKRRHPKIPGTIGTDWGMCGINDYYHPTIVNNALFFTDWKWQMNQCYRIWKGGTTFYGARNIHKQKSLFFFVD